MRNDTMLVEVENREHAEILMKMKPLITLKYKPPPHERRNRYNGVIRSIDFFSRHIEEMTSASGSKGLCDYCRVAISHVKIWSS